MLHSRLSWPGPNLLPSTDLTMDLIVTASGTPIPCNKAALSACSGYFSTQLCLAPASPSPLRLELPTVPAEVFRALLVFIYTGRLEVSTDTVYQLFWYSQMLQIPGAVLKCSQFISDKLSETSVASNRDTEETSVASNRYTEETKQRPVVRPIAR